MSERENTFLKDPILLKVVPHRTIRVVKRASVFGECMIERIDQQICRFRHQKSRGAIGDGMSAMHTDAEAEDGKP